MLKSGRTSCCSIVQGTVSSHTVMYQYSKVQKGALQLHLHNSNTASDAVHTCALNAALNCYSGWLSAARDSLSSALEAVQRTSRGSTYNSTSHASSSSNSGSDTALTAVPVHTATAELLAVMHAAAVTAATARAKKHAEQWLAGDEGREVLRREIRRVTEECIQSTARGGRGTSINRTDIEQRTRAALLKHRARKYARELDPSTAVTTAVTGATASGSNNSSTAPLSASAAAAEHLLTAYQLLLGRLGESHPATSAAAFALGQHLAAAAATTAAPAALQQKQ
eukprot:12249-Heterococcus_DN1.PRE.1